MTMTMDTRNLGKTMKELKMITLITTTTTVWSPIPTKRMVLMIKIRKTVVKDKIKAWVQENLAPMNRMTQTMKRWKRMKMTRMQVKTTDKKAHLARFATKKKRTRRKKKLKSSLSLNRLMMGATTPQLWKTIRADPTTQAVAVKLWACNPRIASWITVVSH